jgi:hypothetical protein
VYPCVSLVVPFEKKKIVCAVRGWSFSPFLLCFFGCVCLFFFLCFYFYFFCAPWVCREELKLLMVVLHMLFPMSILQRVSAPHNVVLWRFIQIATFLAQQ